LIQHRPPAAAGTQTDGSPAWAARYRRNVRFWQHSAAVATINITTGGVLQAQYISSGAGACSSIRIHWLVDGTEVAVTGFVAPAGSSGFSNLGPVSAGPHVLGLQAEGQVGGCNTGTLGSWDGTAQATTSSLAPVSAPTLSELGLVLLMILVALGAAFTLRSRRTTAR
jgi:hypothetical protein